MVGIDARNADVLRSKFICPKCSLILRDPVQLVGCEHRMCQSCVDFFYSVTIKCPDCLKETPRGEVKIDYSFQNAMQSVPIDCPLCNWSGTLDQRQSHLNQHHQNPMCYGCSERFQSVNELNKHRVLRCPNNAVDCILKDFDCRERMFRGNINDHYNSDRHQEISQRCFEHTRMQIDFDRSQSEPVVIFDPNTALFREICESLDISIPGGEQYFNHALLQFQKKFPKRTLDFFRTEMSAEGTNGLLDEDINDVQYMSNDGTVIWIIKNFQEKMGEQDHHSFWMMNMMSKPDAQSERQTSIYSPPFYSSPTGYKMRARLYLHGYGNARRTHMSLFFVLMRGPNDAILKFPFNYKVTFCLYDQSGGQRHIIDSFRPDIHSSSFQRPRSEMNIASGIPKFFPLTTIQQEGNPYVRDDTMFIKVLVDFNDMPNCLLHYAMGLNPGLPTQRQLVLVQQEAARRAQQENENNH